MLVIRIQLPDGKPVKRLTFDKHEVAVGRDDELNDIAIGELSVSKTHALIARTQKGVVLTDLGSTNGTQVNGSRISKTAVPLRDGDVIEIGGARLWVEAKAARQPMRTYDFESGDSETSAFTASHADDDPSGPLLPVLHDDDRQHTQSRDMAFDPTSLGSLPPQRNEWYEPASDEERRALTQGVAGLIDRLAKAEDLDQFTRMTRPDAHMIKELSLALAAQVKSMPEGMEPFASRMVDAARRELVDVGPLGPWLEDAEISEIHCFRYDHIELVQKGETVTSGLAFTTESALHRAALRLARRAGQDWMKGEVVLERRLPGGGRLVCFVPPTAPNVTLTIKKREVVQRTMSELVEGRSLSSAMGTFLARCMRSRVNIVVCGHDERAVLEVVAALAAATADGQRITVLHAGVEVRAAGRKTTLLALPMAEADEEAAVRAALQLGNDHTFLTSSAARAAASSVRAIAAGGAGVVVGLRARTLDRGLGLTIGEVLLARPGLPHHAAATLVANALEIGLEIETTNEGRARVVRIAEIDPPGPSSPAYALRDLFVYTAGGGGDAGFIATEAATRHAAAASEHDG
jgi:pilus assembly protein CpaF